MRFVEREYCTLIEGFFDSRVIAGFTKPVLKGVLPLDIQKALSFLNAEISVSSMNQLHSAIVCHVDEPGVYEGDALFARDKNHALVVKTADCLPLFFYSEKHETVGVVHMGWRSAEKGILNNIMFDSGCRQQELSSFKVIAGVGLRQCCYEVGKEFFGYPDLKPFLKKRNEKFYFDSVDFAREVLFGIGLKRENFLNIDICNFCQKKVFFSYRKTATADRILSFILRR